MANVTTLTTEISDALSKGKQGCVLCSLWLDEEESLTEKIEREAASMNSELRGRLVNASGFCNRHTHAIHKASLTPNADDVHGCSACARTVVKKFQEDLTPLLASLEAAGGRAQPGGAPERDPLASTIAQLERTISGVAMCPICEQLLESDKERIAGLLQVLEGKDLPELYSKSDALCMPHFVTAMELLPRSPLKNSEGVWSLLVRTELTRLETVDHLLNERMKKYSWDFRNEGISPEEANSQKTAMLVISGVEGLYCRPRKTSLRPARA
jgi:hypothetical protein